MNKSNRGFLVIAFVVLAVLFLYLGSGAMMHGGMNGSMNQHGWIGGNGWGWLPALFTFGLVVFVGWLLFRKKV